MSEAQTNVIGPNVIGSNVYKSWIIFLDYVKVINEYTTNYESSAKYKKGDKDNAYLMLNGYNALTHIFKIGISYTRNPYFALKNMHRSIYYYTQFIDQMDENIIYDLNLSSNSASIFLYKKMSEEIEQYNVDNTAAQGTVEQGTAEQGTLKYDFCKNIENLINIYKILFETMVIQHSPTNISARLNEIMVELCASVAEQSDAEQIASAGEQEVVQSANEVVSAQSEAGQAQSVAGQIQEETVSPEENFQKVLENVKIFINHFSVINTNNFAYIKTYIQKYKQHSLTINTLYKKKTERDYETILNEGNANKYIKWLIK
jgi:hypothetical protein